MKWFFLALLVLLFTPQPAFAGGGPFGLEAFAKKPFSDTKTFIVAARLYADNCDSTTVTARLDNQSDGDTVSSFTPPDDGTYYEPHYFTGQPKNSWVKICMRYFLVKSSQEKLRTLLAETVVDGQAVKANTQLPFGNDDYSKQVQNFDRYNNVPQIDIISEKSLGGSKREVKVQWNKLPGIQKYAVFARELVSNGQQTETGQYLPPLAITEDTKATLNLASDLDFNLSTHICSNNSPCDPAKDAYEVLLSRIQSPGMSTSQEETNQVALVTPASNPNEDKMEKLNKKVAELEGKLQKSEQKQNILEEKINQLFAFIRSLFPSLR